MVLKKQKCPYCNKEISRRVLFYLKNDKLFKCEKCKNISLLKLDEKINIIIKILVSIVALVMVVFSLFKMWFTGAIIIAFLFIGFYVFVPNFLYLKKQDNEKSQEKVEG